MSLVILAINLASILVGAASIFYAFRAYLHTRQKTDFWLIILGCLFLLVFKAFTNALEWGGITSSLDFLGDFSDIAFALLCVYLTVRFRSLSASVE